MVNIAGGVGGMANMLKYFVREITVGVDGGADVPDNDAAVCACVSAHSNRQYKSRLRRGRLAVAVALEWRILQLRLSFPRDCSCTADLQPS